MDLLLGAGSSYTGFPENIGDGVVFREEGGEGDSGVNREVEFELE